MFSFVTLLSLFSLVVGLNLAQAAPRTTQGGGGFTPGNLVVVRVGNGSGTLSNAATPVFLDEYTPNGDFVQAVAMPTALNGNNRRLTMSGSATSEGALSLSGDGQWLLLAGYDADVGTTSVASSNSATVNRVVAKVSLSSLIDTTNVITDAYSANNIRGATGNGDNLWATGTGNPGGVRFLNGMGTTTTLITPTNTRVVHTYGGNLYFSSSSATSRGIFQIGNGLPTSAGQTITPIASATSPYGFVFFLMWQASLFFQVGLVMGNLNALAMEPLGHIAGMAASVIGAVSTVMAAMLASPIGLMFNGTITPLIGAVLTLATLAFALMLLLARVNRQAAADPAE